LHSVPSFLGDRRVAGFVLLVVGTMPTTHRFGTATGIDRRDATRRDTDRRRVKGMTM
jgi:hypothetical protein